MAGEAPSSLTQLLRSANRGDTGARDRLWNRVYDELHKLAHGRAARERRGDGPQTTSIVHEAFIRLSAGENLDFADRRHFYGAAARAMRQICIDHARKRGRRKRGGDRKLVPIVVEPAAPGQDATELLAIAEVLERLEGLDPRKAELITLRYFAGLTEEETASLLGLSRRTVQLEWRFARAWLHRELSKGDSDVHRPQQQ